MKKLYFLSTLSLWLIAIQLSAQIMITQDIDYISGSVYDENKDLLDIYMPVDQNDVPVIVYFHGGALRMGDKSWGKDIGEKVAESGIGLVSVNYRLSPDFQHPAHISDAAAATSWVFDNIKTYGGNPQKIYLAGHSAGAYLAALLAIDTSLLQVDNKEDINIKGTILISPFLYVEETAKDRIEMDSTYKKVWGNDPQAWLNASVTPHIRANRDNILLIYADGDDAWRKEQNERFAQAMTDEGNLSVFTKEVPNRTHLSLISELLDNDDMIVKLIVDFVFKE